MRSLSKMTMLATLVLSIALVLAAVPATAGDTILSNNSGPENAVFYIEGEPSLVINGFDLTPLGLPLPVAMDIVSIAVNQPVPGGAVELVVYQDGNGGSPIDATLVYRQPVALEQAGINQITLNEPAIITEPVVWVGFYLPVDFRFYADQSGSSVLTYWAWTPGGAFELESLANAAVLGPGDGSDPVGIAMNGVARISAELRTAESDEVLAGVPIGQQLQATEPQNTSIMRPYDNCESLLYDPEDIAISAESSFTIDCFIVGEFDAPTYVINPDDQRLNLQRGGALFKLDARIPQKQHAPGAVNWLPVPVTHCLRVPEGDLETAVLGEAHFVPEKWIILPSVRFGDMVCAEVTVSNYIAYFTPRSEESPPNVNLVVGWARVDPHPLICGLDTSIQVPIANTGQSWFKTNSGYVTVAARIIHVSSGTILAERSIRVNTDQFGPGARPVIEMGPVQVETFVDELQRIEVFADYDNEIQEINEADNIWTSDFVLKYPDGQNMCATELQCLAKNSRGRPDIKVDGPAGIPLTESKSASCPSAMWMYEAGFHRVAGEVYRLGPERYGLQYNIRILRRHRQTNDPLPCCAHRRTAGDGCEWTLGLDRLRRIGCRDPLGSLIYGRRSRRN